LKVSGRLYSLILCVQHCFFKTALHFFFVPPLFPYFDTNTFIKTLGLYFANLKEENCKFAKFQFFIAILSYLEKNVQKHFWKALDTANSNMQNKICFYGKLKMWKFSLKATVLNLCKISSQKFCNLLLLTPGFPKSHKSLNPMTGSRSKYRFSPVKVKQGIQAICLRTQAVGIKAPLWA